MSNEKITFERYAVPISFISIVASVAFWISSIASQVTRNKEDIREVKISNKEQFREINSRLSSIQKSLYLIKGDLMRDRKAASDLERKRGNDK